MTDLDLGRLKVVLCDVDGNLLPSEDAAYDASIDVTNRMLEALGLEHRFTANELRLAATGKNFRASMIDIAPQLGIRLAPELVPAGAEQTTDADGPTLDVETLDEWTAEEARAVTAHLREVLEPDEDVLATVRALADRFTLAAVSSSALKRLDGCLEVTGLAELLPAERRYSAADSLDRPTSKPDPAVYILAGEELGVKGAQAVAIEDSLPGVQAAVAAGFPTVGNLRFVAEDEREERRRQLQEAGVCAIVESWAELAELLDVPVDVPQA